MDKIRFLENEEPAPVAKQTKINNNKSKFVKQKEEEEVFEQKVSQVTEQIQNTRQRAVELTKQYWDVLHDQTLTNNKGPLQKSVEKEILSSLTTYALELNQNTDGDKPEGYGSIAMINLLFKSALYFRDKNNDLEYKVKQLEDQYKLLSSKEKVEPK